ncbi:hypothetical protein P3T73_08500 [Kiritimatiellota bacterium B12222]|nr:hypothetical protein P3T73_08500 [Kiritimatiellota bacterium B12222]
MVVGCGAGRRACGLKADSYGRSWSRLRPRPELWGGWLWGRPTATDVAGAVYGPGRSFGVVGCGAGRRACGLKADSYGRSWCRLRPGPELCGGWMWGRSTGLWPEGRQLRT